MDKVKRYIPYLLLTGLTLFFCRMFVGRYGIFGAKVDWLSQHSVLPDYFRQQFYATGKLFPEFAANLGGGQNIYHFAYYGLYSPLILPSYLLPFVKMSDYIMAVSITGLTASVLLFYYWLKSRKTDAGTAFILSLMFLLAGPMIGQYSGQIMFVDYMPFLCLALIGVDRYFEQEKSGLFTVSVFLMIMTSFYFSIGGMLSLVLYGLHRYFEQREGNRVTVRSFLRDGLCFVRSMILAVLMSGFFLVPTALALTGGRSKEQNTSFASFFIPQITVERFAYSIYGIGLTTLVITVLLTGLLYRKVYEKVLTYGCVIVLVIPVFAYLLNGGLYIRDKVFIPFLPLLCYLISIYLEKCRKRELSFIAGIDSIYHHNDIRLYGKKSVCFKRHREKYMESPACRKYSVSDLLRAVLCDEEIPQRDERDSDAGSAVGDMSGSHDEHFLSDEAGQICQPQTVPGCYRRTEQTGRKRSIER